jgi:deoxyribose-phosphate aldolase
MQGLRQKILMATSEDQITKFLEEGKTYEFASVRTRNSWKNAARRKAAGEKYVPTTSEQPAKKKKIRRSR